LRYLITILLLLSAYLATGQKMAGRITDKETGFPLFPVMVTNLITRESTLSDENGHYTISATEGQYIAFTFISYKAQQKKMPFNFGTAEMNIQLQSTSFLLDEATISSFTKYQKDSLLRQQNFARPLAAQHAGFMSPFSALAELFSKTSKQTFRFQDQFYTSEPQLFIDSRYSPDLVHSLTKLNGDTLAHFMNSYNMPYDFARNATDLELKMWIRTQYKEYMAEQKYKNIPVIKDTLINAIH
jgi:hypothetical protein